MKPFISKINRTSQMMMVAVSFFVLALPWSGSPNEEPVQQIADTPAETIMASSSAAAEQSTTTHDPVMPEPQVTPFTLADLPVRQLSRSSANMELAEEDTFVDWSLPDPFSPDQDTDSEMQVLEAAKDAYPVQPTMHEIIYVAANRLNLRTEPSTESEIIVQLRFGAQVICQAELEGWVQVLYDEQIGYLSAEFISWTMVFREVRETVYISARRLNLRTGPSTEDEILLTLRRNDKLTRTGIGDGWSSVQTTSGTAGYVASEFLTKNPPVTKQTVSQHDAAGQSEIDLFKKIVALESHYRHGYDGYLAVATVIMNRVASSRYPNTITRVVSQPGQFSVYTSTRKPYYTNSVQRAIDDALAGKRNLPEYVLFFATPGAYQRNVARNGIFSRLEVYKTDNGHVWCYYASDR